MTVHPELIELLSFAEQLGAAPFGGLSPPSLDVEVEAKRLWQAAVAADATADDAHNDFLMLCSMHLVRHPGQAPLKWSRAVRRLAGLARELNLA